MASLSALTKAPAFATSACRRVKCVPFASATPQRGSASGSPSTSGRSLAPAMLSSRAISIIARAADSESERPVKYNKEFGYSRKDIIIITFGLIGLGYAMYYGLQATGMEPGMAGNWVQLVVFMGICVGWISTYLFRVATKQMTYVKQLEAYEEAVMRKRVEEMTEGELEDLVREAEADKARRGKQ